MIGADVPRDSQRARVYAAEAFVRTLFDRVTAHGSPTVEFFGTQLTLPQKVGSVRWHRCSVMWTTCLRYRR